MKDSGTAGWYCQYTTHCVSAVFLEVRKARACKNSVDAHRGDGFNSMEQVQERTLLLVFKQNRAGERGSILGRETTVIENKYNGPERDARPLNYKAPSFFWFILFIRNL